MIKEMIEDRYKLEVDSIKKQIESNFLLAINEALKNNNLDDLSIVMQNYNEYVLTSINNYNFEMVRNNNSIIASKKNIKER
jgi:hypothetical protein